MSKRTGSHIRVEDSTGLGMPDELARYYSTESAAVAIANRIGGRAEASGILWQDKIAVVLYHHYADKHGSRTVLWPHRGETVEYS